MEQALNTIETDQSALKPVETPQGSEVTSGDLSLGRRMRDPRTLLSFGVAIALITFLLTRVNLDVERTWQTILSANLWLLVAGLVAYYTTFPLRGLRWRLMLTNAGFRREDLPSPLNLARIVFLSWFANCLIPAKLGDVYRAYLVKRSVGISLTKAGGTIVAERVIDFAVVTALLAITAVISFRGRLPGQITVFLEVGSVLVVLGAVGLLVMRRWHQRLTSILPLRIQGIYGRFREGAIGSFGSYRWLIVFTFLIWASEVVRLFFVTRSVGLRLTDSLPLEITMLVFLALGSALLTSPPGTPGGLGYVEATLAWALILLGAEPEIAIAVALLDRAISYLSIVVFGAVTYIFYQKK